jgi:hypothetical protein
MKSREVGRYGSIKLSMFEPFESGKMLTWQQVELFLSIKRALNGQ